jgi:hypothetical protein
MNDSLEMNGLLAQRANSHLVLHPAKDNAAPSIYILAHAIYGL